MKNLLRCTLISLGLMGLAQMSAAAGDPEAGKALAGACAACHGEDGNSPSPMFPKLAGLGEKYLLMQLQDIKAGNQGVEGGRPVPQMMGLLEGLSERDLVNLASYYSQQPMQLSGAQEAEVQLYTGEKVDALKLGASIYRSGNLETGIPACTGCHSPRGLGNAPTGYPRLGGQHAAYIEEQLKAFRAGNRVNDGEDMPMREIARRMSDAEITAVANFIAGLH
jgi:cytochrome c553